MRDKLLREFCLRAWIGRRVQKRARARGLSRIGSTPSCERRPHGAARDQQAGRSLLAHPAGSRSATCHANDWKTTVPHAASGLAVSSSDAEATWRRWHWRIRMRECCGRYSQGVRVIDQRRFPPASPKLVEGRRAENGYYQPEVAQAVAESWWRTGRTGTFSNLACGSGPARP